MRSFMILYFQVKYYYGDQIKEEWTGGHMYRMKKRGNVCSVLVMKPE